MRRFVAAVMAGERFAGQPPPVELVQRAHLGPVAYRSGLSEHRAEYAASAVMAARRAALLDEVVAALRGRGVRVALIKGIAHAGTLYPDPAERPMQDIDLLIRPNQVPDGIRAVTAIGFEPAGDARMMSGYYHALTFARGDMMLELHRGIVQHGRTGLRMFDLWRRARPDEQVGGAERLDPADDLLVTCLHIARHELLVPILSYLDVLRGRARLDDTGHEALRRRAATYRVVRPLEAVLAMTDLLAAGGSGTPAAGPVGRLLPSAEDVLLGTVPGRLEQVTRKLILTGSARGMAALGLAYGRALLDGRLRGGQ